MLRPLNDSRPLQVTTEGLKGEVSVARGAALVMDRSWVAWVNLVRSQSRIDWTRGEGKRWSCRCFEKRDLQDQIKRDDYLPRPFLGNGWWRCDMGIRRDLVDGGEEEGRRERKPRIFFGWGKSRWAIRLVFGQGRQGWWVWLVAGLAASRW